MEKEKNNLINFGPIFKWVFGNFCLLVGLVLMLFILDTKLEDLSFPELKIIFLLLAFPYLVCGFVTILRGDIVNFLEKHWREVLKNERLILALSQLPIFLMVIYTAICIFTRFAAFMFFLVLVAQALFFLPIFLKLIKPLFKKSK